MFNDLGYALIYGPMEEYKLEKQSFYALFGNTRDASPVDDLMQHNKSAWTGYCEEAKDSQPYQAYLLEQEDGTIYLGLSADYAEDGSECFCMVYRLEKQDDTIYASMDDYAAACVAELKKGTMSYCTSEDGNYASQVAEDTVADVRVTQLEMGDSLGNLSPDGTVLELWYFQYEMKPTNEAGVELAPIGGQYVTDDGYLRESWTHYLTVLHYTSGEKTGYQVIGTYTGNDGLWYDGCNYSGEEKYYLHDFYIDYAGLDLPKMFIPNLLNDTATDGYGRANQCEARLISGDGSYYFYAPITAWACNPGTEFWYSRYDTGSYFNAKKLEQSLDEAKAEWESTGAKAEKTDAGWRFVTHEGMSNTVVTLFNGPNNTCYIVEIHWLFDGSTEENQWGWNRDRAVEGEAEVLRAMVRSFTVNWDADAAADPAPDDTAFQTDLQLASNGGASWLSLNTDGMAATIRRTPPRPFCSIRAIIKSTIRLSPRPRAALFRPAAGIPSPSASASAILRALPSTRARISCSTSTAIRATTRSAATATMRRSSTRCSHGTTRRRTRKRHLKATLCSRRMPPRSTFSPSAPPAARAGAMLPF